MNRERNSKSEIRNKVEIQSSRFFCRGKFRAFTCRICSLLAAALLAIVAAGQSKEASPMNAANEVAVIKTSEGDMVVQFWTDAAPNTIDNFKKLAKQGFYNGTIFHRIVRGFMIQGGDPNSKDPSKEAKYGDGGPGYKIKAEFNDHPHDRGVISMAREPDPDSAGSQFFICLAPVSRLDHQYTTFGKLIKGDDVLDKIGNTRGDTKQHGRKQQANETRDDRENRHRSGGFGEINSLTPGFSRVIEHDSD